MLTIQIRAFRRVPVKGLGNIILDITASFEHWKSEVLFTISYCLLNETKPKKLLHPM